MPTKNSIPETSYFFVHFNNGDTHYFTVKKVKETFNIYWTDFIKAFGYERNSILPRAHKINFTKNSFTLIGNNQETICNLENYNQKIKPNNEQISEIKEVYIDPDLRQELLGRGQLTYSEDASRIPGILFEPVKETLAINKNELFEENYDDELYDYEYDEEYETSPYTRSLIRK